MHWKPTKEDKAKIRKYAGKVHGLRPNAITLQIGARYNTEDDSVKSNINVALVTKKTDDEWNDTDLDDKVTWSDFCHNGAALTHDLRGIFDFWVYSRGFYGELEGQIQAYILPDRNGEPRLARLEVNGETRKMELV